MRLKGMASRVRTGPPVYQELPWPDGPGLPRDGGTINRNEAQRHSSVLSARDLPGLGGVILSLEE